MSATSAVATIEPQSLMSVGFEDSQDELKLVRQTYGNDVSDNEFRLLVADARHRGLSVVKREILAIKFSGKIVPFVTIAGLRRLAGRQPLFAGGVGPFFCGPDGQWTEVWLNDKPPAAAKYILRRRDWADPVVGVAIWKERAKLNSPTWKEMPSVMLGKVAESDAIKRSGLISDDLPVWYENSDEDGDETQDPRIGAMRYLHKIGRQRNIAHEDLRTVVTAVKPGTASMADPTLTSRDFSAAAGLINALDDDAVERVIAEPEAMAKTPDEAMAVPIEVAETGELIGKAQAVAIRKLAHGKGCSTEDIEVLLGMEWAERITYVQAKEVIAHLQAVSNVDLRKKINEIAAPQSVVTGQEDDLGEPEFDDDYYVESDDVAQTALIPNDQASRAAMAEALTN